MSARTGPPWAFCGLCGKAMTWFVSDRFDRADGKHLRRWACSTLEGDRVNNGHSIHDVDPAMYTVNAETPKLWEGQDDA